MKEASALILDPPRRRTRSRRVYGVSPVVTARPPGRYRRPRSAAAGDRRQRHRPARLGADPAANLDLSACYSNYVAGFAFDTVVGPTINGWTVSFGTSAAAPHVAGIAALVIGAHGGQMNPDAVEAILLASADDVGKPGLDDFYGHGRVNAAKAVGFE